MRISKQMAIAAVAVIALGFASPANAQNCTRQGNDVSCDDGRRGNLPGDAIIWPDGTKSNLASPHPSVIIGNKSSVIVGQGVIVGGRARARCRWTIPRRTRRAAPFSMASHTAIDPNGDRAGPN